MHVLAYDPYVAPERFPELGVEPGARSLEDLFAASDFASLHLTLTAETRRADRRGRARAAPRTGSAS